MKVVRTLVEALELCLSGDAQAAQIECNLRVHHMGTASLVLSGSDTEIEILDDLKSRMIEVVPPWGGGKLIYDDQAIILATLARSGSRIVVESVKSGTVNRPGEGQYDF